MKETVSIINLSALVEPKQDMYFVTKKILSFFGQNAVRDWPSIRAYLDLCNRYKPACMGIYGLTHLGWLAGVYKSQQARLITDYKSGKINTDQFLLAQLKIFDFLKNAPLEEKEDLNRLLDRQLISLQDIDIQSLKEDRSLIAKAMLEEAWVARMHFDSHQESKVQDFFARQNGMDKVVIISNSNEIDIRATIRFLQKSCPELLWEDGIETDLLKVPDEPLEKGITLTTDGKVMLYVSYAHRAYKTGIIPETGMATNGLLELIYMNESLNEKVVTLISQWGGDLKTGYQLGFNTCVNSEEFFSSMTQRIVEI